MIFHAHTPDIGGINGDVKSDLTTLADKNREQLEDFHSIILIIQQEIIVSI